MERQDNDEEYIEDLIHELNLKSRIIDQLLEDIDQHKLDKTILIEEIHELLNANTKMQNRESVLKDFLQKHDFGIHDIEEFITELKVSGKLQGDK